VSDNAIGKISSHVVDLLCEYITRLGMTISSIEAANVHSKTVLLFYNLRLFSKITEPELIYSCELAKRFLSAQTREMTNICQVFGMLLLICCNVSVKMQRDDPLSLESWAQLVKVNLSILVESELELLDVINWKAYVSPKEISDKAHAVGILW
jgi:hypothetical protein